MKVGDIVDGRYRLLELLGEGAAGKVFRAEDRGRNQMFVALKLLHAKDPRWEGFFRREFEVLSRLHHQNLVRVYDFGPAPDESTYYFTQELVVGSPLLDVVVGKRIDEVCGLFIEICRALEFIHAHGVLHRDLKPANILVQRHADPGERVRVLDFGLWRELDTTPQKGARWAGTPPYLASEVLRGFGHSISADLYAVGVTLFQAITRKLPHGRGTPQELLAARKEPAPSLRGIVPDPLADLVARLLDEEAERRPQAAAEVAAALSLYVPNQSLTMPVRLGRARLVGRDNERKAIEDVIQEVREGAAGAPRLVVVQGARGVGKSRLAGELKAHAQLTGGRSAIGRALENVRAPYRPFADLVRAFTPATEFAGLSEKDRAVVERLCPEIAKDPMSIDPHVPDGEKPRFHAAVADFFLGLAAKTPTVLIIEDAPYLDVASVALVTTILRRAREAPLVVIVTAGTDDDAEPLPREILTAGGSDALTVTLSALDRDDVAKLVAALLGVTEAPKAIVDAVLAHAGGNPLVIEELLALFIERGDLVRSDAGWAFASVAEGGLIPGPLPPAVATKLARLAEEEQCVLSALAVFARPASAKILGAIAGLERGETATAIEHTMAAGLLKVVDPDAARPRYVFSHPRIREVLLKDLVDGGVVAEWHLTAAEVLEERAKKKQDALAELVAHHYERAGEAERALAWFERAIAFAMDGGAMEDAIDLARRARRLAQSTRVEPELLARLDALTAQAMIVGGRLPEARPFLEEAIERTDAAAAPLGYGTLHRLLGHASTLAGAVEQGRRLVDGALGRVDPKRAPVAVARVLLGRAELLTRDDPDAAIVDAVRAQTLLGTSADPVDLIAVRMVLCGARRLAGNVDAALVDAEGALALAIEHGRANDAIAARRQIAALLSSKGDRLAGRNHLNQAHREARERGYPVEEAFLVKAIGEQLYVSGAFSEAVARFQQAATLFAQMGVELERAEAIWWLGLCYAGKGDYGRAIDHLVAVVETFDRAGTVGPRVRARARLAESLIAKTEIDDAERHLVEAERILPATGLAPVRAELLTARGALAIARGDFAAARRAYLSAVVAARRAASLFAIGEALTGYAQALVREKHPQRAKLMVKRAESIFIALDARGQLRRITPLINAAEGLSASARSSPARAGRK